MPEDPAKTPPRDVGRRAADVAIHEELEESRSAFAWLEERTKRIAGIGAFYLLLASVIGWIGGRIVSPREEHDKLREEVAQGFTRQDSLRTALSVELRVVDSIHATAVAQLRDDLADQRSSARFQTYVLCILTRRQDPSVTPPECGAVINAWRPR